ANPTEFAALDDYEEESSSAGYHTDESCSPTPEPGITEVSISLENFEKLSIEDPTVERLTERYAALYGQAQLHTLDALDALEPLKAASELKAKILYSVVVVPSVKSRRRCRLLRLYEGRQYREAASFLMRLPTYTLRAALPDIPIDLLIETLPHSLAMLEALYSRLTELNLEDPKTLKLDQVLWKAVYLISTTQDHFHLRIWSKLLGAITRIAPNSRNTLVTRRRALERAVEGLGKHGLVPSSQNSHSGSPNAQNLVPLPNALKEELEARNEAYKLALHKIENFGKHGAHKDQGVQAASHQRQLSLRYSEVQQRLIDNQSLLNTLEKASNLTLENLLDELKRRVEQDKEALRQWTALRKTNVCPNAKNPALAAGLLQFSRGCGLALQLMSEDNVE
ncbi:uncharacterized protein LOC105698426, partial [Orussus abietinus]|uniref:uncharacterized protein LOC105698426 n=1 Tax=Orussus abietinus TaxID=222816 RepID=UPI000C7160FD